MSFGQVNRPDVHIQNLPSRLQSSGFVWLCTIRQIVRLCRVRKVAELINFAIVNAADYIDTFPSLYTDKFKSASKNDLNSQAVSSMRRQYF